MHQADDQDGLFDYFTHDYHPDYLITQPESRTSSIMGYADAPEEETPTYYYQGMRCYTRFRDEGAPRPESYFRSACQTMHDRFVLDPIVQRRVANRGDLGLAWYPAEPEFELALFRVVGPIVSE